MYRALVNGRWLPWVSNADPQWMDSVKSQYNLDGTLDYTSYYAGIDGQNISGLEIRAFVGTTNDTPIEGLVGQEAPPTLSYMVDNNWTNFDKSVIPGRLDGLKIQTDASKPYYITYRTHNQGQGTYYPFVTSRENDYAGSAGKPIQLLSLYVYKNDGTKLVTGVVVMYRAYVEGRWLPWVSNANPDWMRSVQAKYNLDGTLDDSAYYAGIDGKNISGIEVRIFEENNANIPDTPQTPSGQSKIIDAPFISQLPNYPTGCESVSAVMALQYAGVNISVDTFIDKYLYKTGVIFDPNESFGGDPRGSGYGCYSPVIKKALDKILTVDTALYAREMKGEPLQNLCSNYIDKDIPVILWATMGMDTPKNGNRWYYNGKLIQWIIPEHCLLLVGYDDEHYIFNDPLRNKNTYYRKSAVEIAYAGLGSQAITINKLSSLDDYQQPPIPDVPDETPLITSLIDNIYSLENLYVDYRNEWGTMVTDYTARSMVLGMTSFLRSQQYSGFEWYFTTKHPIDSQFIEYVQQRDSGLFTKLKDFMDVKQLLTDGDKGLIDLPHLAATMEAYLSIDLPPNFWAGWGGDLATGMADVTNRYNERNNPSSIYYNKSLQQVANMTIGNEDSSCNYTDFCCDFDAYKMSRYIEEATKVGASQEYNIHLFSDTLKWYYQTEKLHRKRFNWIFDELGCSFDTLRQSIFDKMNGFEEWLPGVGLLALKGNNPSVEVHVSCCYAFSQYISKMIQDL